MKIAEEKKDLSFLLFAVLVPVLFIFVCLLFFCFDQSVLTAEQRVNFADLFGISGCVFAALGGYVGHRFGKLDAKLAVILLIVVGFFVRLAYITEFGFYEHQHDVESLRSSGHLSYIYNLATGNGLPESNEWQYSHPPLYHVLAAGIVKLSNALGFSPDRGFENIQLLTLLFSTLISVVSVVLFKELRLKGKPFCLASAFCSLHPTFFIFAGSINNDCLMTLLSLTAVLFLVKWWHRPTVLNAVLIGLFIGLGMMTKFSVVLLVPVTAVVVIVKLLTDKTYKFGRFLLQTALFLAVSMPAGLWYQIRNVIKFQQPLGYVAPIPETSDLFVGDVSIIKRILLPFSTEPVDVYVDVWEEHNLFTYVLRNSLFGEYQIGETAFAVFLVIFNLSIVLLTVAGVVSVLKKGRELFKTDDWIILLVLLVQLAFFVYFNISYPFGCTMDFRYIPLTVICSGVLLGRLTENDQRSGIGGALSSISTVTTVGFCVFSLLVFI
ncbi:MAG: glycosyltransferase family 39 protein [Ruminococcaceae bacterium]|nr:glycosyltransferase family 39 protein [Oscillospiraceae bacterium]